VLFLALLFLRHDFVNGLTAAGVTGIETTEGGSIGITLGSDEVSRFII